MEPSLGRTVLLRHGFLMVGLGVLRRAFVPAKPATHVSLSRTLASWARAPPLCEPSLTRLGHRILCANILSLDESLTDESVALPPCSTDSHLREEVSFPYARRLQPANPRGFPTRLRFDLPRWSMTAW